MYEILVPDDVEVTDLVTEKPTGQRVGFAEWVRANLLPDVRFTLNEETLEHQEEVRVAIRGLEAGGRARLSPNAHKLLAEVAKSPKYRHLHTGQITEGYGPYSAQYLRFMEAIRRAERVKEVREAAPRNGSGTERREVAPGRPSRES